MKKMTKVAMRIMVMFLFLIPVAGIIFLVSVILPQKRCTFIDND